jgi:hypothetical protein
LGLYIEDVPGFHALIRRSYGFLAQAEMLAPILHQDWLYHLTPAEKCGPYYKPFEELDQEGKEANIAAAIRIPEILALAGLVLKEGVASRKEERVIRRPPVAHLWPRAISINPRRSSLVGDARLLRRCRYATCLGNTMYPHVVPDRRQKRRHPPGCARAQLQVS